MVWFIFIIVQRPTMSTLNSGFSTSLGGEKKIEIHELAISKYTFWYLKYDKIILHLDSKSKERKSI